jgi:hypothetical protein
MHQTTTHSSISEFVVPRAGSSSAIHRKPRSDEASCIAPKRNQAAPCVTAKPSRISAAASPASLAGLGSAGTFL